jgi:GT2 family glycosyltransferase
MTRVNLIIPTYNGAELLAPCLASLARSSFKDFAVTVYDDGSTDPVEWTVAQTFPSARVIRSPRNRGLVHGFNVGIAGGDAEFVVLLNDDTEVEPTWLDEIVACAERHPEAGSIASKLRLMSDRGKLHSAGDYYSVRGMPGNRGVWLDDLGQFDREEPVFSACGGAALFRRAALQAVTLSNGDVFDSRLFMYCEDVDLGWRLQRAGYTCWFAPRAVVYHHLSATGGGPLASYYVNRNVLLLLARSVPSRLVARHRSRIIAHHLGRLARAIVHAREPAARAALRGTAVGLFLCATNRDRAAPLDTTSAARVAALLEHQSTRAGAS